MKWENSTAKGMNFFIENSSNLISSILVDWWTTVVSSVCSKN
jgi:hypothetical protein